MDLQSASGEIDMSRRLWVVGAGAAFALGGSVVTASTVQEDWRASPDPLRNLLTQHDGPMDLAVAGDPEKCIRAGDTSGIVLNDRQVIYHRRGQIYVNTLARPCTVLGPQRLGKPVHIVSPLEIGNDGAICSGDGIRIADRLGPGPGLCELGDFVPVEVIGAAGTSAASARER